MASNDGQKGMGLIMLILIGIVPTAFALNRAIPDSATPTFSAGDAGRAGGVRSACGRSPVPAIAAARTAVTEAVQQREIARPQA